MNYFDLHCDTATCLFDRYEDFENTSAVVNARSAKVFDTYCQTFAFWTDDSVTDCGFERLKRGLEYFEKIRPSFPGKVLFSVEGGGAAIDGDPENLYYLKEKGFVLFGLSWNGKNALAAGNASDPKKGLTPLGKKTVRLLDKLGIVPDISHLSDAGVFDLFSESVGRVCASHSCCREVYGSMRNITDEMICEIIKRNGLIGLNLYPEALSESPKAEDLLFHAEHILSLGGKNCLSLGADWDGTSLFDGVFGLESVPSLFKMFEKHFSLETAEKIFYKNAADFFKTTAEFF